MRWRHRRVRWSWPGVYAECGNAHPHPCRRVRCTRPVGHTAPHMAVVNKRIITWRSTNERSNA